MNLIIIQPDELEANHRVILTDERARHIRKVLRAEVGKVLRIGLLNGPFGTGMVQLIDSKQVELSCQFEENPPPRPLLNLVLAMPRPKVMKRLWAQVAALGVDRLVILNAEKVEKYYFDSHVLESNFYEPLLIEGLQQARCTHLPEVLIKRRFKPFMEDEFDSLFSGALKLVADPSGEKSLMEVVKVECGNVSAKRSTLHSRDDYSNRNITVTTTDTISRSTSTIITVAIGPEGGWNSFELNLLQSKEFKLFSMGSRILRTDTACISILGALNVYLSLS